jgi:hypothetical protein
MEVFVMVKLPHSIWQRLPNRSMALTIKIQDGRIRKRIYVNNQGVLEGRIVGGQDGLDSELDFSEDEIIAVRQEGILALLGFRIWIERK